PVGFFQPCKRTTRLTPRSSRGDSSSLSLTRRRLNSPRRRPLEKRVLELSCFRPRRPLLSQSKPEWRERPKRPLPPLISLSCIHLFVARRRVVTVPRAKVFLRGSTCAS